MKANELKVQDLMVGDWLMFNDKPCQVKGLHNDDTVTLTGYRSMYYLIDAEPIPLTPEILEKNGFKLEYFISEYFTSECEHYIGIDDRVALNNDKEYMNSNNEWCVHVDSETYCTIATCELTYLHELQHILRLCKIDKEIVV